MGDLAIEPYIKWKSGDQYLYKFKNGNLTYTEQEFKDALRKSIKEGISETKQETKPVNTKNNRKKSTAN